MAAPLQPPSAPERDDRDDAPASPGSESERASAAPVASDGTPGTDERIAYLSCRSKRRYDTEAKAKEVAALAYEQRGHWLRAYRCEDGCGGWHVTHRGATPPSNANWRPPAKSKRLLAKEANRGGRRTRRRRRKR